MSETQQAMLVIVGFAVGGGIATTIQLLVMRHQHRKAINDR